MNATDIVALIGSTEKTADMLGVAVTQIYRMTYPRGIHNGLGNRIPSKYFSKILSYSEANNLGITRDDLWDMI